MLALWQQENSGADDDLEFATWNGAAWAAAATFVTAETESNFNHSLVNNGDTIHYIFYNDDNNRVEYMEYTTVGGWVAGVELTNRVEYATLAHLGVMS